MTAPEVHRWLIDHARPLPLDPTGPPVELPPALAEADVVGLASAVRSARQLVLATHALIRSLVEHAGFRAVSIDGTGATGPALDRFVRTGDGDPVALVAASQSFLRTHETLDLVRWLRAWSEDRPGDPVSIVHDLAPEPTPTTLDEIEQALARRELVWRHRRRQRIVHWGGTAHMIAGDPRTVTVPSEQTHRNAGGILRAELGRAYAVAALTVGSGTAPFRIPPPPPDFAEHSIGDTEQDAAVLLDLPRPPHAPPSVVEWLDRPLRTRMIGPIYDPAEDHHFRVDAGPLRETVDVIVHAARVTATRPL